MQVIEKKKTIAKQQIIADCGCNVGCPKCSSHRVFIDSMATANIPENYWLLSFKQFQGAPNIKNAVENYIHNLDESYKGGKSLCFAGSPGTGKTMSACTILKSAIQKGYTTFYTSFPDMIFNLMDHQVKNTFNRKLMDIDFLCIDEVDARHFADSENSENFFGRNLEKILRFRIQNRLPIIFATNHIKLDDAFGGQFKKIIESISAQSLQVIPALGPDYRIKNKGRSV
mgnify:CR=1 FL=1